MIKTVASIFLLISLRSLGCDLTLPDKIFYVSEQNVSAIPDGVTTNCEEATTLKVISDLASSSGSVPGFHIAKSSQIDNLKIKNNKVSVFSLNEFIKEKLALEPGLYVTGVKVTGLHGPLTLKEEQHIQVKCYQCNKTGTFAINLEITSPFGKQTKWGQIHIQRQVQVLKAKNEIRNINTDLNPDMFEETFIYTERPSEFIKDKKEVVFYKNNKHFPQGYVLKKYDIVPINLVQRGQQAKVIIRSSSLKLSGTGLPLRSGTIGQNIELRNPISNKTFSATVIDFNKVMVEL